jgi:hypothetical protein
MTQTATVIPQPLPDEVLPPFSGEDTECVKCSHPEAFTAYRPAVHHAVEEFNGQVRRGPLPERLERRCQRCDFQWDEALQQSCGVHPATAADIVAALQLAHQGWALDLSPECAEHMAAGLLEMFLVHVRPGHPVWAKALAPRPLLVPPAEPVPVDQPPAAAVPISMPHQPTTTTVVPLQEMPQPPAGHPAFDPAADK